MDSLIKFSPEEQRIFDRFPKLFRRAYLPVEETCMCWGLDCPEYWYPVIERLCEDIDKLVPDHFEFTDIKTKWRTARIYFDCWHESEEVRREVNKLVDRAEEDCNIVEIERRRTI
jgi:hypothetical protein